MNKSRFLSATVILLLLLNTGLIVFMILGRPPHRIPHIPHDKHPEPRYIIIDRLGFDARQVKEYNVIIAQHQQSMKTSRARIGDLKKQLYVLLRGDSLDAAKKDSLVGLIAHEQVAIENANVTHFAQIKKICRRNQLEKFNALLEDLNRIFAPPPPPHERKK